MGLSQPAVRGNVAAAPSQGGRAQRALVRVALAGIAFAPAACGRLGYGLGELTDRLSGDGGMSSGGSSSASGSGGDVGTAGAAQGGSGEGGGAAGAGGSAAVGGSHTRDAGASVDAASVDSGLTPAGCAPDVPLRQRPEADPPAVVDGLYDSPNPGWTRISKNTYWVELQGQGYVALRWEIEYAMLAGQVNLPTLTSSGTFLRVGGGGGYHLDDPKPGTTGTYMGNAQEGISYMAPGVATPWHIEFYYLDGSVTIVLNEGGGLHNIEVQSQLYSTLTTRGVGVYGPGIVCDRP